MEFIGEPSAKEKIKLGLSLAIQTPDTSKVFAAKSSEGDIVGILVGNKGTSIAKSGYYFWINELHIRKTERNQGVGTALLSHVIDWCKLEDIRGITLAAAVDNEIAKKLYLKHKFDDEQVIMYNTIFKDGL